MVKHITIGPKIGDLVRTAFGDRPVVELGFCPITGDEAYRYQTKSGRPSAWILNEWSVEIDDGLWDDLDGESSQRKGRD